MAGGWGKWMVVVINIILYIFRAGNTKGWDAGSIWEGRRRRPIPRVGGARIRNCCFAFFSIY